MIDDDAPPANYPEASIGDRDAIDGKKGVESGLMQKPPQTCPKCEGHKGDYVETGIAFQPSYWEPCKLCNGTGKIPAQSHPDGAGDTGEGGNGKV